MHAQPEHLLCRTTRQYAMHWFTLDLLAALPLYLFVPATHALRLVRLLRMAHLPLRGQWSAAMRRWPSLSPKAPRAVLLALFWLAAAHCGACAWLAVSNLAAVDELVLANSGRSAQYVASFTQSLRCLLVSNCSPPAGDARPQLLATALMIVGGGLLLALLQLLLRSESPVHTARHRITRWMDYWQMPRHIQVAVNAQVESLSEAQADHDVTQRTLINLLSPSLRRQVVSHVCRLLAVDVSILSCGTLGFRTAIVGLLRPLRIPAGEYVLTYGETIHHILFVRSGTLELVSRRGHAVQVVKPGGHFGEEECFGNTFVGISARAQTPVELLLLQRTDAVLLAEAFPNFKTALVEVGHLRDASYHQDQSPAPPPPGVSEPASWERVVEEGGDSFQRHYEQMLNRIRILEAARYIPRPADLRNVDLPEDVRELQEFISHNTHEVWSRERMRQGWRFGAKRDNRRK